MNPSDFLDVLQLLHTRLSGARKKPASSVGERRHVRAVIGAWFSEYRPSFVQVVGEEAQITSLDSLMQELLQVAGKDAARRTLLRSVNGIIRHFTDNLLVPVSRAYWSKVPQRTPAGRDEEMARRLRQLDPELADSYDQAVLDVADEERISYRGPAAELREILTGVLHKLAPNKEVESTDWYKAASKSGTRKEATPTRAERTKFILRSRAKGATATDAAESYMTSTEERLANVVNATYKRGSAATHGGSERDELLQLLPYVNALLRELLPS